MDRHDKLGIKQTIQKHWMDRVVKMMLAGIQENEIRTELAEYLKTQKQSGGTGERGLKTYKMAIGALASWFSPSSELRDFVDRNLAQAAQLNEDGMLPLHWSVIIASYPFWLSVSKQVGRLLALQDQVTQKQVVIRLKEQYGDRETISRNTRYVLRSMVAWGVLRDSDQKGAYEKADTVPVVKQQVAFLVFEAVLHAMPTGKIPVQLLLNHPGLFPFSFDISTSEIIAKAPSAITVQQFSSAEDMLILNG